MRKEYTTKTKHGKIEYYTYICDNCQKESYQPRKWFFLHAFLRDYEYLRAFNNSLFEMSACSLACVFALIEKHWVDFVMAYNKQFNDNQQPYPYE